MSLKIRALVERRERARSQGDTSEVERIDRQLRDIARDGTPPARKAARRVLDSGERRAA